MTSQLSIQAHRLRVKGDFKRETKGILIYEDEASGKRGSRKRREAAVKKSSRSLFCFVFFFNIFFLQNLAPFFVPVSKDSRRLSSGGGPSKRSAFNFLSFFFPALWPPVGCSVFYVDFLSFF